MKPFLLPMVLCGLLCACSQMEARGTAHDRSGHHVDPRDGHVYRTIEIGGLIWFAENLAYMPRVAPGAEQGGIWMFGYEGRDRAEARETSQYRAYGNLYDWNTAIGACPEGWRLPSDEEWAAVEIALGMTPAEATGLAWRGSDQGARLKQSGDSASTWCLRAGDPAAASSASSGSMRISGRRRPWANRPTNTCSISNGPPSGAISATRPPDSACAASGR